MQNREKREPRARNEKRECGSEKRKLLAFCLAFASGFVIRCSRARSPQQPRNEPNPGTRFRFQNPNYLRQHRTDSRTRQFYRHFPPWNEPTRSSSHFGRLKHIFMIYYRAVNNRDNVCVLCGPEIRAQIRRYIYTTHVCAS